MSKTKHAYLKEKGLYEIFPCGETDGSFYIQFLKAEEDGRLCVMLMHLTKEGGRKSWINLEDFSIISECSIEDYKATIERKQKLLKAKEKGIDDIVDNLFGGKL